VDGMLDELDGCSRTDARDPLHFLLNSPRRELGHTPKIYIAKTMIFWVKSKSETLTTAGLLCCGARCALVIVIVMEAVTSVCSSESVRFYFYDLLCMICDGGQANKTPILLFFFFICEFYFVPVAFLALPSNTPLTELLRLTKMMWLF
jgi:hypothetical protein